MFRTSIKSDQQDQTQNTEVQNNTSSSSTGFTDLPTDELYLINSYLPGKTTARMALSTKWCHGLFQAEVGKEEAKEAAEYAINPTKENVENLKALLVACPALLLHPMTVKNRHDQKIKGTIYQIALHEGDEELIDKVIKPPFEKLDNGAARMEEQHKAWLCHDWLEAEDKACANALAAIDNVFAAFINASHPNDVTELRQYPYTITIHDKNACKALAAARSAIDALYQPTDEVITSGRDPIIRVIEYFNDQYIKNYDALGGDNRPRNNALMRSLYGYFQRFAPINFMQAFAQGIYYIVNDKQPLIRSFEYSNWPGRTILPLDSDPLFRLGNEYYACVFGADWSWARVDVGGFTKLFINQKQQLYKPALCRDQSKTLIGKGGVQ